MSGRPAIVQIAEGASGNQAEVTITLAWAKERYTGSALGSPALQARPRLIGEATLRAVEAVTNGRLRLNLAGIATQELGPVQVAMAHVTLPDSMDSLVGTAMVEGGDTAHATVKAVLDAINRRLTRFI